MLLCSCISISLRIQPSERFHGWRYSKYSTLTVVNCSFTGSRSTMLFCYRIHLDGALLIMIDEWPTSSSRIIPEGWTQAAPAEENFQLIGSMLIANGHTRVPNSSLVVFFLKSSEFSLLNKRLFHEMCSSCILPLHGVLLYPVVSYFSSSNNFSTFFLNSSIVGCSPRVNGLSLSSSRSSSIATSVLETASSASSCEVPSRSSGAY